MLSGFELYPRWVPLYCRMNSVKNPLDIYSFLEHVAQCRPVLLLFKGAVEYFQLCDGKDEGFVSGKSNNFRVAVARPMTFQRQIRFTLPF